MTGDLATVTSTSPLLVQLDNSLSDAPAFLLRRGDTFAPAVNARVVVIYVAGNIYVAGLA